MERRKYLSRILPVLLTLVLVFMMGAGELTCVYADEGSAWDTQQTEEVAAESGAEAAADKTEEALADASEGQASQAAETIEEQAASSEAAESKAEKPAASSAKTKVKAPAKAKRFTLAGYDITFTHKVLSEKYLAKKYTVNTLKAAGSSKSVKLTWDKVSDPTYISGYYIARKDKNTDRYRQVASVGRNAARYTDKTATSKSRIYQYIIIPYKKTQDGIKVARPGQWAGAVTTRNSAKNVYSISLKREAWITATSAGDTTRIRYDYPGKACTDEIRWSSSDTAVAKVTKAGRIKALSPGEVTITGRLHTGETFSFKTKVVEPGTAQGMIDIMTSWMDYSYLNGGNKGIADIYNSVKPLPVSYKLKYYDAWCDATISAAAIRSHNEDIIGRECSVDRHIKIFKSLGIWREGSKIKPKKGDIIVYNWWADFTKNHSSHIGLVIGVKDNKVTVMEGNKGPLGVAGLRTVDIGWRYIKGYARPDYKRKNK